MKGFSIIVCCYNSANVIEETIRDLAGLQVPAGYAAEVVVVDNGCTDHTPALARAAWNNMDSPFDLVVVKEDKPGLSYARNKGIASSRYDYLLFCDDDNRLSSDYLLVAASALCAHPGIGVLGGWGVPDYEAVPAHWPKDFYIYGCGPQAAGSGETGYVHGAGVVILREAYLTLKNAGFTFLLTDRKGDQLSSGGDYELCYAIKLAGYLIWYEQRLTFRHFITADRLTPAYCWKFIRESAPALDVLDVYQYHLRHGRIFYFGFYLRQLKLLLYHGYHIYRSARIRRRYREYEQITFLEDFHIRFHKMRIKCIIRSLPRYRRRARRVLTLRDRLRQPRRDRAIAIFQ